jgi:hypothetical protein
MTLDRGNLVITVAVGAIALAGFLGLARAANALTGILAVGLFILLGGAWALSPCEFVVDGRELRVLRRAGNPVRVPLDSVTAVASFDAIGPGTVRIFGVGGFFGSYGVFWNRALGRFRAYATHRGPALIVRRTNALSPIVITPDDISGAVAAVERAIRGNAGA